MSTRAEHEEILATIAQSYDAGDYEYLPPEQLQRLNQMIAEAWAALERGGDMEARIGQIQKMLQS